MARKIFDEAQGKSTDTDAQAAGPAELAQKTDRPMLGQVMKKASFGSLGGIGRSLDDINRKAIRATEVEKLLAEGQTVVELETNLVDPSFVRDRMQDPDARIETLRASIKELGQQQPILVRPNPGSEGRYQIAYGHRRFAAAKALGIRVRAIVRQMSDDELVIAQGQENNERANLTFIERAHFAMILEERGFSRDTIATALSAHKPDISRFITIVTSIPRDILEWIGPAPKCGRTRWLEFIEFLKDSELEKGARSIVADADKSALSSNDRFEAIFAMFKKPRTQPVQRQCIASDGTRLAKATRSEKRLSISLAEKAPEAFGDFIIDRLPTLYDEFLKQAGEQHD